MVGPQHRRPSRGEALQYRWMRMAMAIAIPDLQHRPGRLHRCKQQCSARVAPTLLRHHQYIGAQAAAADQRRVGRCRQIRRQQDRSRRRNYPKHATAAVVTSRLAQGCHLERMKHLDGGRPEPMVMPCPAGQLRDIDQGG
jgi:hypothetical protein